MLLHEHDAKELLAQRGLPVPAGELLPVDEVANPTIPGPWMVKAQVPVGGRGKAGGIRRAETPQEVTEAASALRTLSIRGHKVGEVRIESAVVAASELYLSLTVDAASARIAVMASVEGGIDIEEHAERVVRAEAMPDAADLERAVDDAAARLPEPFRRPIAEAGRLLAHALLDLEATLIEINPLFLLPDGGWIAGDVRMALDESALPRQPELRAVLDRRASTYAEATFKRQHGYDFVVVDPDGEIGLVTTGAGLSMKLIDEMTARGARPFNFCDIRSGMMRGDPSRLIEALRRVDQGDRTRCALVNIFAGITDLGEFADLLVQAVRALPDMRLPLIVRLVGNGEDRAEEILRASGLDLRLERDLDRAVDLCIESAHEPA